jgi:hypothetical protein
MEDSQGYVSQFGNSELFIMVTISDFSFLSFPINIGFSSLVNGEPL